jgi:hypothetical protein
MPDLNYSLPFAPLVASGQKRQTIRAMRKRPFVVGDALFHYVGMRTLACMRLGTSVAEDVLGIDILKDRAGRMLTFREDSPNGGQRRLSHDEVDELATLDGFQSSAAFYAWFLPGTSFHFVGQLILWPTTWQSNAQAEARIADSVQADVGEQL